MCVCLGTTSHSAKQYTTLSYSLHFHRASMSVRGEYVGPSQVFPEHMHSPRHACGLLDSQEYGRAF